MQSLGFLRVSLFLLFFGIIVRPDQKHLNFITISSAVEKLALDVHQDYAACVYLLGILHELIIEFVF